MDEVKYALKFVLTEDIYFANKMKTTDIIVTSVTDAAVSKGTHMKSIAAHVRCIVAEEVGKMERDVMVAQLWKAEVAPDKSKDA